LDCVFSNEGMFFVDRCFVAVSTTCDVFDITSYMKLGFAENLAVRGRPTYAK